MHVPRLRHLSANLPRNGLALNRLEFHYLIACHLLGVINASFFTVINYQLSVISYQLSVINYQLSVIKFVVVALATQNFNL
ncbi:MAG TPA: hypothetical protein EYP59_21920 [Thiotrichaceae bacterium]|nr:hypothetical protein [Thiotrichaceae bacterium]